MAIIAKAHKVRFAVAIDVPGEKGREIRRGADTEVEQGGSGRECIGTVGKSHKYSPRHADASDIRLAIATKIGEQELKPANRWRPLSPARARGESVGAISRAHEPR